MTSEERILAIINQYYPELDAGPGTPFYEYVVRPTVLLWAKHEEEIEELMDAITLANYQDMREEDMDRLVSRFYITRKKGQQVTGNIRLNFLNREDYTIPMDTPVSLSGGRLYRIPNQIIVDGERMLIGNDGSYYITVPIISDGKGNLYNLLAGTTIPIDAIGFDFNSNLKSAYVEANTSDGGYSETNTQLYYRLGNSLSLKNLTTYRGIKASIFDNFGVTEVTPIGLRDPELRRDVVTINEVEFHHGGMADIYAKLPPYTIMQGYQTGAGFPLGFPYSYVSKLGIACSIAADPQVLIAQWNDDIASSPLLSTMDKSLRGTVIENIPCFPEGEEQAIENLTTNIMPIHDYLTNTDNEALHSDNLVKQYWPIVVRVEININDAKAVALAPQLRTAVVRYINDLYTGQYPKSDDIVHIAKNIGITNAHTPIGLDAYYLTDSLRLEHIGIFTDTVGTYRDPYDTNLVPQETDSLKFTADSVKSQITPRTATWYTDENLVAINIV